MATKKRLTRKPAAKRQLSEADMTSLVADALMNVPEVSEAMSRADLELAIDDRGWLKGGATSGEFNPAMRVQAVKQARLYWFRDPLAKQSVRLWTDYSVGSGMVVKSDDDAVQEKLDAFMHDSRNRVMLSPEGQRTCSKRTLVDGEIFLTMNETSSEQPWVIRKVDTLQITEFISDPEDEDTILAYRREVPQKGRSAKVMFYRDWAATDEQIADSLPAKTDDGKVITLEAHVLMFHVPFDKFMQRGNSLLSTVVDWSREHRRFMEARVALTQALSKFAWKMVAKGGQGAVDKIVNKIQSSMTTSGSRMPERNPPPAAGSTYVGNAAADLQAMPRTTGASDAHEDGNALKLMHCAGTGIMLHYMGDPSTGNLASTTSMELPMLKQFGAYQVQWANVWLDVFSIVLGEEPGTMLKKAVVDVDYPPIIERDIDKLATAVTQFTTAFPEIKVDEVIKMVLTALGINNVEDVMKNVEVKRKENDAKAKETAKAMGDQIVKGTKPPAASLPKESAEALTEAVKNMCEMLEVQPVAR